MNYEYQKLFESYNFPGLRERNFSDFEVCAVSPGPLVMKKCSQQTRCAGAGGAGGSQQIQESGILFLGFSFSLP